MGSLADLNLDPQAYVEEVKPALPEDKYLVICTKAERKPNSKATGELVFAEFTILKPDEYSEGKLGAWFNVKHPKAFAVQKGLEALRQFSRACGLPGIPSNTLELVGKKVCVQTKLQKPTDQYPVPRLDIVSYHLPPVEVSIEDDVLPF